MHALCHPHWYVYGCVHDHVRVLYTLHGCAHECVRAHDRGNARGCTLYRPHEHVHVRDHGRDRNLHGRVHALHTPDAHQNHRP